MTDPIDYSRPVGWWCPVCGASGAIANKNYAEHYAQGFLVCGDGCGSIIRPVYLPIPEGQRPPAASEVEDAEVVTSYSAPSPSTPFTVVRSGNRAETVLEGMDLAATVQRIVTGATE